MPDTVSRKDSIGNTHLKVHSVFYKQVGNETVGTYMNFVGYNVVFWRRGNFMNLMRETTT
jgi:hypothetical protein